MIRLQLNLKHISILFSLFLISNNILCKYMIVMLYYIVTCLKLKYKVTFM